MLQGLDAEPRCHTAPGPAWGRVDGEEAGGEKGRGFLASHHSLVRDQGSREPGRTSWYARSALS